KREVRAKGSSDAATIERSHDSRGLITNQVQFTGTSDLNLTNQFLYNTRGDLVEKTDGDGRKTRFSRDARGRLESTETFETGQSIPTDWQYQYYNENGELAWFDGPRFDPEDYVWRDYDGDGRQIQEIHWRSKGRQDGTGV